MDKIEEMTNRLRSTYLDILNDQVKRVEAEMIKAHNSLGEKDSDTITKLSIAETINEMLSVNALISALRHGGKAKSIILINSFGQAVDLLNFGGLNEIETNIKELNENQLFDQILDNHTLKG
jgi:molecular chaperone GrpE (heat shock protein)